jgi:hypothetical protein
VCEQATVLDAEESVRQLVGKPAWGSRIGFGTFLTIEFGKRIRPLVKIAVPSGEWHLWLYGCDWRIEQSGEVVAASQDTREHLMAAARRLEGKILESVSLDSPAYDATYRFNGGVILRTFSIYSEEGGMRSWYLFTPVGKVLAVGPGSILEWHKSERQIALDRENERSREE